MLRGSVNLIPEAPIGDIVGLAQLAEQLGFERCWVYDEGLATRDVYVTLTAIGLATRHIRLGTGITNPYTRHVSSTVTAIATLDELTGGRAFLGVGAGGSLTLGPLGIERTAPLTAVRDMLVACRGLLSGNPVTMQASTFKLNNARLPYGRPSLELWLAGRGPKMLQLGGELCDGVFLDFLHRDFVADSIDLVRQGATRTDNKPQLCYSTMVVTTQAELDAVKPHMTYRLVDSPPHVRELLGVTDNDVHTIRSAMSDGLHAAGQYIRDEWVTPFVIAGSVSECAEQLARLFDEHAIDEFLLPVLELDHAPTLLRTVADVLHAG